MSPGRWQPARQPRRAGPSRPLSPCRSSPSAASTSPPPSPHPPDARAADQEALPGPSHRARDAAQLRTTAKVPQADGPAVAEDRRALADVAETERRPAADFEPPVEAHPHAVRSVQAPAPDRSGDARAPVVHLA